MTTDDYFILILSHKRPKFLKIKTWAMLDKKGSTAKRYIILSDDDPTIDEYKSIFGEEHIVIFNKEESEKRFDIDLMDCYHKENDNKKGAVWARNTQYDIARKLGYRYFMVFDDDYEDIYGRKVYSRKNGDLFLAVTTRFTDIDKESGMSQFDKICLDYFDILNSSPWLYLVSFAQTGDYLGGYQSSMIQDGFKFKSMNIFFCDTEKEVRFYGRMNEDTNEYVQNGARGELSLTLNDLCMHQITTQKNKEGMTDIYKSFGTYVKSLYTCIQNPSSCCISMMGYIHLRIHHNIFWKYTVPCILDDKYCKHKPLDYSTEVMKDKIILNADGSVNTDKKYSFLDKKCEILKDISFKSTINDFF